MQQTISENFINNLLDTLSVSYIFCTSKVKILLNMNNPQVTKAFNSQVGTSEAIRLLSINTNPNNKRNLNPYFVTGFTDAEGSFQISFKKTA
jgi:hypothetical protein